MPHYAPSGVTYVWWIAGCQTRVESEKSRPHLAEEIGKHQAQCSEEECWVPPEVFTDLRENRQPTWQPEPYVMKAQGA